MSPSTWRLADLFAKHAFLLNGLGFGGMPLHTVRQDLKSGKLVELDIEGVPPAASYCRCTPSTRQMRRRAPPGAG